MGTSFIASKFPKVRIFGLAIVRHSECYMYGVQEVGGRYNLNCAVSNSATVRKYSRV